MFTSLDVVVEILDGVRFGLDFSEVLNIRYVTISFLMYITL